MVEILVVSFVVALAGGMVVRMISRDVAAASGGCQSASCACGGSSVKESAPSDAVCGCAGSGCSQGDTTESSCGCGGR